MIRLGMALGFLLCGVIFIWFLGAVLPDKLAIVLLDKGQSDFLAYPFTVQNLMWVIFFLGMSEILYRFFDARSEGQQLEMKYLPEDERTVLVKSMLPEIYKKASLIKGAEDLFLPNLIKRLIAAFQTTNSVENAAALLNSSIELRSHDLDLRYSILRYIMWVIPTFGFIGTVIGISLALSYAGLPGKAMDPDLLTELTRRLAVAFNTTLVALVMAAILVLAMHIVQGFEERVLNRCGQYCLDNLVNRLYKVEEMGD